MHFCKFIFIAIWIALLLMSCSFHEEKSFFGTNIYGKWELYKIRKITSDYESDEIITDSLISSSKIVFIRNEKQIGQNEKYGRDEGNILEDQFLRIDKDIFGRIIYLKDRDFILYTSSIKTLNTMDMIEKNEIYYYFNRIE